MASPVLERYTQIRLEEELTYGARPTTPYTNPVDIRQIEFEVLNPQNRIMMEVADGSRVASRSQIVAEQVTWTLDLETHPKLIGWLLKWALGSLSVVTSGQRYQMSLAGRYVELPSFTIYASYQKAGFWAAGEDTAYLLGNKISLLRVEATGRSDNNDHRVLVHVEGQGQKPNVSGTNVVTGIGPFVWGKTQLFGSVNTTPFHYKNSIVNWNGAGYNKNNEWQRWAFELTNELDPVTWATDETDTYISDINLLGQTVRCEFDRDLIDSTLLHDYHNATERDVQIRLEHIQTYDGSNPYRVIFDMPRFVLDDIGPIIRGAGGTNPIRNTYRGTALEKEAATDFTSFTATGTDHTLAITTATLDYEAFKWVQVADGFISRINLKLKTDVSGSAQRIVAEIYSNSAGEPGVTLGGSSKTFHSEPLTTTYQTISFLFNTPYYLEAGTTYWLVLYTTSGSGVIIADGDTSGTASHTSSSDAGANWGVADTDQWAIEVQVDNLPIILDYYSDGTYPDAT